MKKCRAKTKTGNPCGHWAQHGKDCCNLHDPDQQEKVAAGRQKGGFNTKGIEKPRGVKAVLADAPDVHLTKPGDVADLLSNTISVTRRGELDPKIANTIGFLSTTLLKAMETDTLEKLSAEIDQLRAEVLGQKHGSNSNRNQEKSGTTESGVEAEEKSTEEAT